MQQLKIGEHFKKTAAMKNLFKKTMLFAAAAMAFVSCENDTTDVNTLPGIDVTVNATVEGTKSHFGDYNATDGTYPTLWDGTEEWYVALNNQCLLANNDNGELTFNDDKSGARVEMKFDKVEASNAYTLCAVSPSTAYANNSYSEGNRLGFNINSAQTPSTTSCDPLAQILVAKSETMTEPSFDVTFKHATAYANFSFTNLNLNGATVQSVTVESEVPFVGRFDYKLTDNSIAANAATSTIALNTTATENLWLACAPVDLQGKKLTFTIITDKGPLTKEVTMPTGKGEFKSGVVAKFNVSMAGIEFAEAVKYELIKSVSDLAVVDEIIIAATGSNFALGTTQNGNNRNAVAITKNGDYIVEPGSDVQIIEVKAGLNSGTYALYVEGTYTGYLYAAGGTGKNNYLKTNTGALNLVSSWTISIASNGEATIKSADTSVQRNTLMKNSSSALFSCYASGQHAVGIYKKVDGNTGGDTPDVPETPAPELTITTPAPLEVGAEGDVATVKYTITNPVDGKSVTASADQTWVNTVDYTVAGEVSFAVDANTGAAREATVTLSYEGATPQTIKISQAAAQQGGGDEPSTGGTFVETFANYKASLSSSATSYGCSGSFAGVSENGITWSYTGCGNPSQTNTDVTTLKGKGLTYDTAVTMGKGGTLSATIPGGATSVSFYILTSSKATCTVTIKGASGSTLKTQTVAKSTTGKVEITGINSNGGDITISFKEASTQNRVTVAGLVYTR